MIKTLARHAKCTGAYKMFHTLTIFNAQAVRFAEPKADALSKFRVILALIL